MASFTRSQSASGADQRRCALEAVRRAAVLTRAVQAEQLGTVATTKADRSPVTIADYGAQAVVALTLREASDPTPILGEENADALREPNSQDLLAAVVRHVRSVLPGATERAVLAAIDGCADPGGSSGRRWVLDPIDGTKGFLRAGQYAIALALLEGGAPVLAVLGCPALPRSGGGLGALFVAERGAGAREAALDEAPVGASGPVAGSLFPESLERAITVAATSDSAAAIFCESVEAEHAAHHRHARIAAHLGVTAPSVRMDSQAKYAAVARGDASIYLRFPKNETYREKVWDHAAGWLVITEAGGRVTDVDGRDLELGLGRTLSNNRGIVATNGRLHDQVLDAIRATAAPVGSAAG